MSDFETITAGLGEERWIQLPHAAAYRWRKPDGEVVVIDPEEIEIVMLDDPKLNERERAMRVIEAARTWRDRVAGSLLGAHEVPLVGAVDEFFASIPATTVD